MKIIIDGMNTVYRMHFIYPTHIVSGKFIGAVYGMLSVVKDLFNKFSVLPEICWEGSNRYRKSIYPEYKAGRTPNPLVFEQANRIKEIFSLLGITQLYDSNSECDDVISYACRNYVSRGEQVFILSNDSDFLQLVSPNVFIYDLRSNNLLGVDYVYNKFGLLPTKIPFFKAITGDSSDNIHGIKYFKHNIAKELVTKFDDPCNMYENSYKIEDTKIREKIMSYKDIVLRNYQLIKLDKNLTPTEIDKRKDIDKVKKLFELYEFRGLLADFGIWEKIFQSS